MKESYVHPLDFPGTPTIEECCCLRAALLAMFPFWEKPRLRGHEDAGASNTQEVEGGERRHHVV